MDARERRGGCASAVVAELRLRPNPREATDPPWDEGGRGGKDVYGLCEVVNEEREGGGGTCVGSVRL